MKSSIILMLILISTLTNSFGNPIYILEVYKNGDTLKYTYKEFLGKMQMYPNSEMEEKIKQLYEIQEKIKQNAEEIKLKEEFVKLQEKNIRTQKIEIISLISGTFGFISFPLFIIFLILYIVTKGKLKKISSNKENHITC